MTEDGKLFDARGRKIMVGDVLKVFHFIGARRKRYYMYQQVVGVVHFGKNEHSLPYLKISHLNLSDDCYHECLDGRTLSDYEILQGVKSDLEDRPRRIDQAQLLIMRD